MPTAGGGNAPIRPKGPHPEARKGNKSLQRRLFRSDLDVAQEQAISSFASREGFVIRSRLANDCFACSSVAQR
jgi:hypothetical protein